MDMCNAGCKGLRIRAICEIELYDIKNFPASKVSVYPFGVSTKPSKKVFSPILYRRTRLGVIELLIDAIKG